jgi:hypothetical protein
MRDSPITTWNDDNHVVIMRHYIKVQETPLSLPEYKFRAFLKWYSHLGISIFTTKSILLFFFRFQTN